MRPLRRFAPAPLHAGALSALRATAAERPVPQPGRAVGDAGPCMVRMNDRFFIEKRNRQACSLRVRKQQTTVGNGLAHSGTDCGSGYSMAGRSVCLVTSDKGGWLYSIEYVLKKSVVCLWIVLQARMPCGTISTASVIFIETTILTSAPIHFQNADISSAEGTGIG